MAEVDSLQRRLLDCQNTDGGWSYHNGSSWTEPTAFALLALEASQGPEAAQMRGRSWLLQTQQADGGWAAGPAIGNTDSFTAVAALALSGRFARSDAYSRALNWIVAHMTPDPTLLNRILFRLRDLPASEIVAGGAPWVPGTAAWIAPTALSAIALSDGASQLRWNGLLPSLKRAQDYIWSRRCPDGGWNHGGTQFRGAGAESYPEMTGLALLALDSSFGPEFQTALSLAARMRRAPQSGEGAAWLDLALMRHGISTADGGAPFRCYTTRDVALRLLALSPTTTNRFL